MDDSQRCNPYLFTGRRYDDESALYYYRTRYMDPIVGRFTTRDTIGIWGDAANLGNGYAYVGHDPWSWIDPYGKARVGKRKLEGAGVPFLCTPSADENNVEGIHEHIWFDDDPSEHGDVTNWGYGPDGWFQEGDGERSDYSFDDDPTVYDDDLMRAAVDACRSSGLYRDEDTLYGNGYQLMDNESAAIHVGACAATKPLLFVNPFMLPAQIATDVLIIRAGIKAQGSPYNTKNNCQDAADCVRTVYWSLLRQQGLASGDHSIGLPPRPERPKPRPRCDRPPSQDSPPCQSDMWITGTDRAKN